MSSGTDDLRSSLPRQATVGDLHTRFALSPEELVSRLETLADSGDVELNGPPYDRRTRVIRRD